MPRPRDGPRGGAGVKRRNDSRAVDSGRAKWFRFVVAAVAVLALALGTRRRLKSLILKCRAERIRTMLRLPLTVPSGIRRKSQGALGILDPKTGQAQQISLGNGCRAARSDRGARSCRLDHRWGTKCDRAL